MMQKEHFNAMSSDVLQVRNRAASTPICKVIPVVISPLRCTAAPRCRKDRIMLYVVEMVWWARSITCHLEAISGLPLKAFSQAVLINQRLASHSIDTAAQPLTSNTCQSAASPLTSFSQPVLLNQRLAARSQYCLSISGLPLTSFSQAVLINQRLAARSQHCLATSGPPLTAFSEAV